MDLLFPLLILVLLVPMFLAVRRQKKEVAKTAELQAALQLGDRVITTSGLYGTVVHLDAETVDLEIAEDVVTTWMRQAIRETRTADLEPGPDATVTPDTDSAAAAPVEIPGLDLSKGERGEGGSKSATRE